MLVLLRGPHYEIISTTDMYCSDEITGRISEFANLGVNKRFSIIIRQACGKTKSCKLFSPVVNVTHGFNRSKKAGENRVNNLRPSGNPK